MLPSIPVIRLACLLLLAAAPWSASAGVPRDPAIGVALSAAVRPLEPLARTGVLYDRVLPLAHLERLDGSPGAPVVDRATWLQAWDELRRATLAPAPGPDLPAVEERVRAWTRAGVVPIGLLDRAFDRVRPGALEDGAVESDGGRLLARDASALVTARALAAAALVPRTFRGADVAFTLDPALCSFDRPGPRAVAIDFADGRGFRPVAPGVTVHARYASPGRRTLTARIERADGSRGESRFALDVAALVVPPPDDTIHVTATEPFQGGYGTGDAYVYLAPGRTSLVNPVVVIEGFDLDNSMHWDELYTLLDQQGLIETLRADGFDAVVLDFTDATRPVEENSMVVAELIRQVQDAIDPAATVALVGASMGGVCSRYALAWMEGHGLPYRVRTWISFDAPHGGADIPLGLQYWIDFFSGQSSSAASFLAALQSPAARQLLLYHFTKPAGTSGQADALRDSLLAHLSAVGGWPALVRRVAVSNGSDARQDQGFAPGAQLILYEYSSLFVSITGDVWAVPNQASATIFNGSMRILFSTTRETVTVGGTLPWDGAPGGWRASMTQLDTTAAPYGDIVALHPSHCFVPTVSALALPTGDPFLDITGLAPPFDAFYVAAANTGHVSLSPESAAWVRAEIERGVAAVPDAAVAARPALRPVAPNPFSRAARVRFVLPRAAAARLVVYGVDGRLVRTLLDGVQPAGEHEAAWDGRDGGGAGAPPGLYFVRLETGGTALTRRAVRIE